MRHHSVITWAGCVVAGLVILFILTNTTSGDGDEHEKLRKEVAQAVQSQLTGDLQPVYKHYKTGRSIENVICIPKEIRVPEALKATPWVMTEEPHKTRYKVRVLEHNYRAKCCSLRVVCKFFTHKLLAASVDKASVIVEGIAGLSALDMNLQDDEPVPDGYKVYSTESSTQMVYEAVPTDLYAHAAAALVGCKPENLRSLALGLKYDWHKNPEKGKKMLEDTEKKSGEALNALAKKGPIMAAFQNAGADQNVNKIYESVKGLKEKGERYLKHLPGSGLLIESWYDGKSKTTSANGVADVRCLVELSRDPKTKKWKVEKMWLLSELDVPKKPEPPSGDK